MPRFVTVLLTFFCLSVIAQEYTVKDHLKHNMTKKVLIDKAEKAIDPTGVSKNFKTVICKFEMIYPVRKVTMPGTVLKKYPDKCKTTIEYPGIAKNIEVLNGKKAWEETVGKGIKIKTKTQLEFMKFQLKNTNPAFSITEIYEKIILDPVLYQVGEYQCYKLICTLPKELKVEPEEYYFDNKEFLPRWYVSSQLRDEGVIQISRELLSYKIIEAVKIPMRTNMYMMGGMVIMNILSIKFNAKIADSEFELPKNK